MGKIQLMFYALRPTIFSTMLVMFVKKVLLFFIFSNNLLQYLRKKPKHFPHFSIWLCRLSVG